MTAPKPAPLSEGEAEQLQKELIHSGSAPSVAAARNETPALADRMATQRAEFDALYALTKRYNSLPAIVDDDYPEARHYYESAVKTFLAACAANGRKL